MVGIFPLSVRRLRFIFAGCLCLWLLGLLHSSSLLFQLDEEEYFFQQHQHDNGIPPLQQQLEVRYRRRTKKARTGKTFFQSKNLTTDYNNNNVLVVGNLSALPFGNNNKNNSNASSLLLLPKPKKPKQYGKKHKKKRKGNGGGWWNLFGRESPAMDLPKPVFVMGFPKAGTSSIFSFFQQQGFRSQHWYCCKPQHDPQQGGPALMAGCMMKNLRTHDDDNNNNNKNNNNNTNHTIFHKCGNFDVFSEMNGPRRRVTDKQTGREGNLLDDGSIDMFTQGPRIFFPQHFHIDKIHEAYPNATWILNHRPVDDWIDSVMDWGDHLDKQFANEYYAQNAIATLPTNKTAMRHFLKTIYHEHMSLIRDFAKEHPTHTLVEVTITDDDAGENLADAFGLESKWWHHRNKNEKGTLQYYARHHMPTISFEDSTMWYLLVFTVSAYLGYTVTPGPLLSWWCCWW